MATAREIAIEVLPHFVEHVLAGHVSSYGSYAKAIGRNPAKESMVIGQAMHAIGAVCVLAGIPVAPLRFVERADGEWRGVFEADVAEQIHVLPHYNLLHVTARIYKYTEKDFARVARVFRETLPNLRPAQVSPHDIWHVAIYSKFKDSTTPLQRALAKYQTIFDAAKAERDKSKDLSRERVMGPASLWRKELILLWCIDADARFWESSRFDCSETAGRIRPFGVNG